MSIMNWQISVAKGKKFLLHYSNKHGNFVTLGRYCHKRDGKWYCNACNEEAPQEIKDAADLMGCVEDHLVPK